MNIWAEASDIQKIPVGIIQGQMNLLEGIKRDWGTLEFDGKYYN